MTESWSIFLLVGYVGALCFSLYKQKTFLREELKYFSWYFVVSLFASILANDHYITLRFGNPEDGVDVNYLGMLRGLWYDFIIPYVIAFLLLNSVRLIILTISSVRKNKSQVS
jgi:hypothetical protein